ncbi:sodium-coupled monocarboxylate transporter 1-like [Pecten maximus]|uniref:sodium-coupled monocarboxylate transporter 1-like n=1 Tax=Pecten maximus TaxID=6579 RepID=UPI00145881D2|nr:sodium-coupled monocarboxylate transporter 1-like [Pecten maximus]
MHHYQYTILNSSILFIVVFGVIAVGIAYTLQYMPGPITQITLAIFGACGGPMAGLFFLGGLFPNANWIGALVGSITAITLNMWIAVGGRLFGSAAIRLEPITTRGCFLNDSSIYPMLNSTSVSSTMLNSTIATMDISNSVTDMVETSLDNVFPIYNISYMWYGLIGFIVTILLGLVVSCATVCL